MVDDREPTRPDLLARYEALNFHNTQVFEDQWGLPRNLISKMRRGDYWSAAAGPTMQRFEEALTRAERREPPRKLCPQAAMSVPSSVSPDGDVAKARAALAKELFDALTVEALERATASIQVALLGGVIARDEAHELHGLSGERRQQLKLRQEQEDKARDGREMVVKVVSVDNWVGGPLP